MSTKELTAVLSEISKSLNNFIKAEADPGLLTGYGGAALFYAYYYKITGKRKHLDAVYRIVERMIAALAESELPYSHCSGISGLAWCIQHLSQEGFIETSASEDMFEEVDILLGDAMIRDLSQGFYDFMHLGLGVTLYMLDKLPHPAIDGYLHEAVSQLERTAEANQYGMAWPDRLSERSMDKPTSLTYNLGLSHGVPAIISVLAILHEKGIAPSRTQALLTGSVNWLLSTKNKPEEKVGSIYPATTCSCICEDAAKPSRIGWCYGDLSVAITLWNVGRRLNNDNYMQEAHHTFEHTLQYRNKENGNVQDASLCHGSMGVSHIYRRMFKATGDRAYLEGSQRWLEETLAMRSWEDGAAGFKYRTAEGFKKSLNLLEGVAGIGLGLIAAVDDSSAPAWDRCLLIS